MAGQPFFQRLLGKYLPRTVQERDELGGTVARFKGVHELLADAVEAGKDLDAAAAIGAVMPWAEASAMALSDALPPVDFVLKLFSEIRKIDDPADLGYIAATLAYQRASEQSVPEAMSGRTRARKTTRKIRATAVKELREHTAAASYDFTRFSFANALSHPFVKDADTVLRVFATALGLDEPGYLILQQQVRMRFVPNLKGILSHGRTRERFAPFTNLMALDTVQARVYDALLEHADYQRWLFEEKPVLGRERFALSEVYALTDCGVLSWGDVRRASVEPGEGGHPKPFDLFSEEAGGRVPILETLLSLIADAEFKDAIVLQGVAGSGKSSVTLRLAAELVRLGLRPIRIEMKHVDTRESSAIEEALPEAVRLTDLDRTPDADALVFGKGLFLKDEIFKEHVLFRGAKICPYVLILDGWDEISVGAAEGYQQQVGQMLRDVRRTFLDSRAFPVRVILAGRPTHAVEASKFFRDETRLLTIRNLSPPQLENYAGLVAAATKRAVERGESGWSLEGITELDLVLKRYRRGFEQSSEGRGEGDLEILGLPLLAHLALRLLFEYPEGAPELLESKTSLYRSLVDLVIGQAGKAPEAAFDPDASAMLSGGALRALLHGTAEAMTSLGSEAIRFGELAVRLNLDDSEILQRVDRLSGAQVLARLMISFFFKGGRRELGAEFSHKSFREYLFAEQVVEVLKSFGRQAPVNQPERTVGEYWKDFGADDGRKAFCHRLAELLGPVWMTPEISLHVRRLLRWEVARSSSTEDGSEQLGESTAAATMEDWRGIRDGLADAWDWWAEGVHLRPQPSRTRVNPSYEYTDKPLALSIVEDVRMRSERNQRPIPARITSADAHIGDALCLLATAVHRELFEAPPRNCPPRRHQKSDPNLGLRFAPSGPDPAYFKNYCARINAAGYRPEGPFPTFLAGVSLVGAMLDGLWALRCDLSQADLSEGSLSASALGNLHRTKMDFVSLAFAYLNNANLREASLREGNLRGAHLQEANLGGANLESARLHRADLRGGILQDAILRDADLEGADLQHVNLQGADLRRAVLRGANLEGAILLDANLEGADLRQANLEGAIRLYADLDGARSESNVKQGDES